MPREYTLNAHQPSRSSHIDYAAELNPQQFEAVTSPPAPALVIAGAGSGKTRTLTYRVAYLVEHGVDPSQILLLTFTNKAAREMLERVTSLIPNDLRGLWGGTFHSIGNRLLRRHAALIGYQPGFSIMDREDSEDMLGAVVVDAGIDPKEKRFPKPGVLGEIFSLAINTGVPIARIVETRYPYFHALTAQIEGLRELYEKRKRSANSLDFDDLLVKTLDLLRGHPDVAARYQQQFKHLLVDEYQDTNRIQAEFIDLLAAQHGNVMVVGDDAQSIYSWRGADFRNILEFPKRYPEAKVFRIETNYRSVPEVLAVANEAIRANERQFEKTLRASRQPKDVKPGLVALADSNQQAHFVAQRILELRDEGVELNDIAVLYRAHFHSMELQMELTRRGVPFQITSGLRFFEQAHIKDVTAYLKFAVNPRDELAFKRMVLQLQGIGGSTADKLWRMVAARLPGPPADPPEGDGGQVVSKLDPQRGTGGAGSREPSPRAGGRGAPALQQERDNPAPVPDAGTGGDVAPPGEPGPESHETGSGAPAVVGGFSRLLADAKVPAKSRKAWDQVIHTMDEIAPGGVPNPPAAMLHSVVEAVYDDYMLAKFANYEARREDINTLAGFARQYDDPGEFLAQLALLTNLESEAVAGAERDSEMVNLSSVHQAKGLEWKVVFVIYLCDGLFPSSRAMESEGDVEEERRLFYVAVTRAMDELYLTWPQMRLNANYGEMMQRPSRFLGEIPERFLELWDVHPEF